MSNLVQKHLPQDMNKTSDLDFTPDASLVFTRKAIDYDSRLHTEPIIFVTALDYSCSNSDFLQCDPKAFCVHVAVLEPQ